MSIGQAVIAGLAAIGSAVVVTFVWLLIDMSTDKLMQWFRESRRKHKIKHRFNRPPVAKCYCIDCANHDNESGRCFRFGNNLGVRITSDDSFCWEAEPDVKNKRNIKEE